MSVNSEQYRALNWKDVFRSEVYSADVYTLAMVLLYSLLAIVYYQHIPMAATLLLVNVLITAVIGCSILLAHTTQYKSIWLVRYFYSIPVIYIMYDQTHYFVRLVHPHDYDALLESIDRWLFGVNPTDWFTAHSAPLVTEYLQICYFLFYVLPVTHAIELWTKQDITRLKFFARNMSFVYFASYLAYFALPAIGPRFTIHEFAATSVELPGVLVTETLRSIVNAGGGIPAGSVNPAEMVNRDCMPSGHTMLTLVNIVLGFCFGSKFRWFFCVIGGSLIISTVYLRYHYAIDVIVGVILVAGLMPLEILVDKYCRNRLKNR